PIARALLGDALPPVESNAAARIFFAAQRAPLDEPALVLNGERPNDPDDGPVNDLLIPSLIAPAYAPPGAHLVSATILNPPDDLDDSSLERAARDHLARWFGLDVGEWRTLRVLRMPHASPLLAPPALDTPT